MGAVAEFTRDELIENNLGLVHYAANTFHNTGEDIEDLVSVGYIGLIKAADTFVVGKGAKFATYATTCIRNEILMFLRKLRKHYGQVSLDASINDEAEDYNLLNLLGTEMDYLHDTVQQKQSIQTLRASISKLDDRDQLVIQRYLVNHNGGKISQLQLAEQLGVSQSIVSRIEKKAIRKLKEIMIRNCIFI
ncbi:MAG: sigma-70 family RNA polymerase sigma factor [Lysinibacillus sp.]